MITMVKEPKIKQNTVKFEFKQSIFKKRLEILPHTTKIDQFTYKFGTGEQVYIQDGLISIRGISAVENFNALLCNYLNKKNNKLAKLILIDYLVFYTHIRARLKELNKRNKWKKEDLTIEEETYDDFL